MNRFFEIAIMITIAITFVNGGIVAFGPYLFDTGETGYDAMVADIPDLRVTQEDIESLQTEQDNTVKEGDVAQQLLAFVGQVAGTVNNVTGGIGYVLTSLYSFGIAYAVVLEWIFGDIPVLWTFLSWTVIPMINLMQMVSITYLLIYVITALRGGSAS